MGGDGKHVLRLDLLPAPQQGESRLTSGDRIPGEGHTCIRSGSQFWSGVTGLARVTPLDPSLLRDVKLGLSAGPTAGAPLPRSFARRVGTAQVATKPQRARGQFRRTSCCPPRRRGQGQGTRPRRRGLHTAPKDVSERVRARLRSKRREPPRGSGAAPGAPPAMFARGSAGCAEPLELLRKFGGCAREPGMAGHTARAGPGEEPPRAGGGGVTGQFPAGLITTDGRRHNVTVHAPREQTSDARRARFCLI